MLAQLQPGAAGLDGSVAHPRNGRTFARERRRVAMALERRCVNFTLASGLKPAVHRRLHHPRAVSFRNTDLSPSLSFPIQLQKMLAIYLWQSILLTAFGCTVVLNRQHFLKTGSIVPRRDTGKRSFINAAFALVFDFQWQPKTFRIKHVNLPQQDTRC